MAKRLPDAKMFATGKGLVPLVRKDIYEWLMKGLAIMDAKPEAGPMPGAQDNTSAPANTETRLKPDPRLWEQLSVGSLVVAPEVNAKDDGYFRAVVIAVSKDRQRLTIRFRDFPEQTLTVKRRSVALLLDHS